MTPSLSQAVREERISSADGVELFVRSWRPGDHARAIVVIVPGFNSHGGYYLRVAERLVARGFAVYAIDLRGRGRSDGERFFVNEFEDYVRDVEAAVTLAASRDSGLPLYLLGHSAGGVVSCVYTLEHQAQLAGLICESFAFQVPAPDFAIAVLKGLSHVAPHAHVLKLKNEDFSRDAQVVDAMNADPLIANETQPTSTIAAMARADDRLKREFPLITIPLLILHGTADKATKPSGSRLFFDTAGSTDKTLELYDGYYHDLLNDVGKDDVMTDIENWLDAHVGAA